MRHLKINSLPPSDQWVDRDTVMIHACFQILQDFVEKENGDNWCDHKEHTNFVDEVRYLYRWWLGRKDGIAFELEDDDDEMLTRLMKIRTQLWT